MRYSKLLGSQSYITKISKLYGISNLNPQILFLGSDTKVSTRQHWRLKIACTTGVISGSIPARYEINTLLILLRNFEEQTRYLSLVCCNLRKFMDDSRGKDCSFPVRFIVKTAVLTKRGKTAELWRKNGSAHKHLRTDHKILHIA